MEVISIMIDTNAYAEFKKGNPEAVEIIRKAGNIIVSSIVIGELLAGFKIGTKEHKNIKELTQFLDSRRVVSTSIDSATSEEYGKIFKELRMKGKPAPTNDIWIAASARQLNLPIFSYDRHFKAIENIRVIATPTDL